MHVCGAVDLDYRIDRLLQRGNKCNQANIHKQRINNKD